MSPTLETQTGNNNNSNTSNDNNNSNDLCEECKSEKYKYKCPACSRRTCSLTCVNAHKKTSGCTGKRDATVFVPLSHFDDSTLVSDYNLLEDVKRVAESSQRMRTQLCLNYQYKLPRNLKALQVAAARRRTQLLFFPSGMSKRQKNQTRTFSRYKDIQWTIEWRFHSTNVTLLEHMVHEKSTLRSVMEKHLQPSPWRNKLRRFAEVPVVNLKFLIRLNQKRTDSRYRELDLDTPLRQLFLGLVILEYPIVHILLPSDPCNFEVVNDIKRTPTELKAKEPIPVTDDTSSPLVICSKEEEIIEDGSPEPNIFDFHDKSIKEITKTSPTKGHVPETKEVHPSNEVEMLEKSVKERTKIFPTKGHVSETKEGHPSNEVEMLEKSVKERTKTSPTKGHVPETKEGHPSNEVEMLEKSIKERSKTSPTEGHVPETKEVHPSNDVEMLETSIEEFDFDQELMDAYSLLLEQGNPDNFLDYNREGEGEDFVNTDVFFADVEELEEGEIPTD